MKMTIENTSKLLLLRRKLQAISEISFSFSTINHQYPINNITAEETQSLLNAYHQLMKKVGDIYHEYEEENNKEG